MNVLDVTSFEIIDRLPIATTAKQASASTVLRLIERVAAIRTVEDWAEVNEWRLGLVLGSHIRPWRKESDMLAIVRDLSVVCGMGEDVLSGAGWAWQKPLSTWLCWHPKTVSASLNITAREWDRVRRKPRQRRPAVLN